MQKSNTHEQGNHSKSDLECHVPQTHRLAVRESAAAQDRPNDWPSILPHGFASHAKMKRNDFQVELIPPNSDPAIWTAPTAPFRDFWQQPPAQCERAP